MSPARGEVSRDERRLVGSGTLAPHRTILSTVRPQAAADSRCCADRSSSWQPRHAALKTASPAAAAAASCDAAGRTPKCRARYVDEHRPLVGRHLGAPALHLGDLAIPAGGRQPLRHDQVGLVTAEARRPRHLDAGSLRQRRASRRCAGAGVRDARASTSAAAASDAAGSRLHLDPHLIRGVPQVARRIPLRHHRLGVAAARRWRARGWCGCPAGWRRRRTRTAARRISRPCR